jgi:RNA polymerase sigma-70 factor (ECF subfamily)
MRLTCSKDFADDLFGDTWVRVAEKYHQLNPEQNAGNWIYTICLNIYRKSLLKKRWMSFFEEQNVDQQCVNNDLNAEELSIEKETNRQLQKVLRKLSDKYRIPIILFYFKDLSYQDIADMMRLPIGTIKFRLNQAKKILKEEMNKLK